MGRGEREQPCFIFRVSGRRLTLVVEAVEKVPKQVLARDAGKSDLTECATINDLMAGKGQATPENHSRRPLRGFFYRLVMQQKNINDKITNYLRSQNYADHVIKGGLPRLLSDWESASQEVAKGNPAYIMYEEFLNDMDGRRIIQECFELLTSEEQLPISEKLMKIDEEFKKGTIETASCIWGEENAKKYGYSRDVYWYYYRRPKVLDDSWPEELVENIA